MSNFTMLKLFLLILTVSFMANFNPKRVMAVQNGFDPAQNICAEAPSSAACQGSSQKTDPINGSNAIIPKVANIIAVIGGIIAVVMVIYGGLQIILSGGESSKVANGRNTIIYTAVGVAVIVFARGIILFVVSKL